MSFRLRLILAFTLLALIQAALFTLVSNNLLVYGLEGELNARLSILGEELLASFHGSIPANPGPGQNRRLGAELAAFAARRQLQRATLFLQNGSVLDSLSHGPSPVEAARWWAADGLTAPSIQGSGLLSVPLFKDNLGAWVKVTYLKSAQGPWLRLEAGTSFLGQVSRLEKRLYTLAWALGIPSLLAGLLLGLALSRRAGLLKNQLAGRPSRVALAGKDEFAAIAGSVQDLLFRLDAERREKEALSQAKVQQARSLALGVAHEIRNPLASMNLMTDLLLRRVAGQQGTEELQELCAQIRAEAVKLDKTVAAFLDFARAPDLKPESLDLKICAQRTLPGLLPQPVLQGEALAFADPKATGLVLGNLIKNACEASLASGAQAWVKVHFYQQANTALAVVTDSGAPVPAGQRPQLFTPFFTTKTKGLGLGLATSAALAQAMGGQIALQEDGKSFVLQLPAFPGA